MKKILFTLLFFLLVAQICLAQWVQVGLNDESIKDIAVQNSNIFAVTSDNGKLYRSVDNGINWVMIVDSCACDVAISPTGKIFMVVKDSTLGIFDEWKSLYYSDDNGDTWILSDIMEQISDSLPCNLGVYNPQKTAVGPTGIVFCFVAQFIPNIICGARRDCFAISIDNGLSWRTPDFPDSFDWIGGAMFDFRNEYAITLGHVEGAGWIDGGMSLSSDYGITWEEIRGPDRAFVLGFFSNCNIIVGEDVSLQISTDMGSAWTEISTLNCQVGLSWSNGSSEGMLIGSTGKHFEMGVFLFSDEGDNLGSRNEGLTNLNVQSLTSDNNGYVYAGTGNGVWRRPLSEVTPVEENQIEIPSSYNLSQNFPNPFNPSTKIKYSVPQSSQVVIKVFDMLGNEIETLVKEEKPVGTYELTWDADNLPSGVYFYLFRASSFVQTRKMILLK